LLSHNTSPEEAYIKYKNNNIPIFCKCGCKEIPKWRGWKVGYSPYIRGHNARDYTAFTSAEFIKRSSEKRKKGFSEGKYKVWNDGLTKETSKTIQAMSDKVSKTLHEKYRSGELVSWQTGLTKETDERLLRSSQTKKRKYETGEAQSWNQGLTKETDHRVEIAAFKISARYNKREAGKRLNETDVISRIKKSDFTYISGEYKTRRESKLFIQCNTCKKDQYRTLYSVDMSLTCFYCRPKESKAQIEINEFIRSLNIETILSDRSVIAPQELDILVPSKNIAIEYNGLYWHSANYKDKKYHSGKTDMCNKKSIQLIHIFEDEWRDKNMIVKSLISAKLGIIDKKIFARKCEIREVPSKERKEFFNNNHIDGDTRAKISFGLYFENELVSCISLRKSFHKKWNDYFEVARSASIKNTNIIGGLSRLTKHAFKFSQVKNKKGILSYVDTRYGNDLGYIKAGYKKHGETGEMFWWSDNINRFNRFKIRANKELNLTEKQVAQKENMTKIYGCKNLVFLFE